MESEQKKIEKTSKRSKILSALMGIGMLAMVAAPAGASYTFTGNLSDLGLVLTDFMELSDELIQLVIFGVVITAAGAIGGFITGFFGMILGNMRVRM